MSHQKSDEKITHTIMTRARLLEWVDWKAPVWKAAYNSEGKIIEPVRNVIRGRPLSE